MDFQENNRPKEAWESNKSTPCSQATMKVKSGAIFDNLFNYEEASEYLGVSSAYLRKLKAQGKIPWVAIGSRAVRFRVSSLNRWAEEREIK